MLLKLFIKNIYIILFFKTVYFYPDEIDVFDGLYRMDNIAVVQ